MIAMLNELMMMIKRRDRREEESRWDV